MELETTMKHIRIADSIADRIRKTALGIDDVIDCSVTDGGRPDEVRMYILTHLNSDRERICEAARRVFNKLRTPGAWVVITIHDPAIGPEVMYEQLGEDEQPETEREEMSMTIPDPKLLPEEAEGLLAGNDCQCSPADRCPACRGYASIGEMLARHKQAEIREALRLPWSVGHDPDQMGDTWWVVNCDGDDSDETLSEDAARLMATSPAFAEQWERWLNGEEIDRDVIHKLLKESGWLS